MVRIPVTVITGFLGSGKTTLLNRLLRDHDAAGTVVVVNEFGEIGLDHHLIESSDDSIILLTNGCLCCSVKGDLVNTLRDLIFRRGQGSMPRFDRVVIETTGLADPCSVMQVILTDPVINSQYALGSIIATVDAVNGLATLDSYPESARQAAVADRLVLTKLDLLADDHLMRDLAMRLHRLNPAAVVLESGDDLRAEALLASDVEVPEYEFEATMRWKAVGGDHAASHRHDIKAFCIVREQPIPHEVLYLMLRAMTDNLGPNLLRVKGLLNIVEEPDRPAVLQGAQTVLHELSWLERWPSEDRRSRLVFITDGVGKRVVDELIEVVESLAAKTRRHRERHQASG